MLYALSAALKQKAFKGVGVVPHALGFIPALFNHLPFQSRQDIYRWSGGWNALAPEKLKEIKMEEISEWVIRQYPRKRCPAIMIGSSNGAAIHLAAALGIPWLPQTFLAAVRRELNPDEIEADIEWGRKAVKALHENNPHLKINQMHDPVQDRLMIAKMAYFRLKYSVLGGAYERFIRETLAPGGEIIILDNTLPWPMISVSEAHTFQVGGLGELTPYEYLEGSPRVEAFSRKHNSSVKCWPLPGKVFEGPESEWGFHEPLGEDIRRFSKLHGYHERRVVFEEPETLSPFAADLYQWWYKQNNIDSSCLLVECFALLEPWMTLLTASTPFWLAFNTTPSLKTVESYLKNGKVFDEICLMLMSNGIEGIGQVSIEEWKGVLSHAKKQGAFLGVDEQKYPLDFMSFLRYHGELKKKIKVPAVSLQPLTLSQLDSFVSGAGNKYKIRWQ